VYGGDSIWPPQFAGLLAAFVGMIMGSLMPQARRLSHWA
jgi:solute:Na+ symporter, SSS family